jgi:hypothetical protein
MTELGKLLIGLGAVILVAGVGLMLLGRTNLPLGRLPGISCIAGRILRFIFRWLLRWW